jgi:large repetitive protein
MIMVIIGVSAAAAIGLFLAFAGGNNLFSANNAPVAIAGTDRTVDAGSFVELDGSSSRDPDNSDTITSYRWEQISGYPEIRLNNPNSANPSFSAPDVTTDTKFTFELTTTDEGGQSSDDNVEITVKPVSLPTTPPDPPTNQVPVANTQAVTTNQDTSVKITLSGSDADNNDSLTFSIVSQPSHGSLSGTAPNLVYVPQQNYVGTDSFTYKVNDGKADSNTGTVTINVRAVNDRPIANAGLDQTVNSGDTVTLNGAASTDADGSISYSWRQTSGPSVNLIRANTPTPAFVASSVSYDIGLVFLLIVTDDEGVPSTPDTVSVTVKSAPSQQSTTFDCLYACTPDGNKAPSGNQNGRTLGESLEKGRLIGELFGGGSS